MFVTSRTYVRWSCLQSARRRRLGGVELGSAVLSARAGDTDCDGRSSTYSCCLHSHTCAVEPLVPYVDNIHEVIKKPFVAKGPQQFAMKACNSSNLCYSVVVCARRQELHCSHPQYLPWQLGTPSHNYYHTVHQDNSLPLYLITPHMYHQYLMLITFMK